MQFNTSNQTWRQLMGNGIIYQVPPFQRDYAWNDTQWHELWQDITDILDTQDSHYMGYLVVRTTDNRTFEIIDGQQRMVTLSIIVLAVIYNLEHLDLAADIKENNDKRAEILRNSFIGYLDSVSLKTRSKLNLNRNNNEYYQKKLVTLHNELLTGSKQKKPLMGAAFLFFKERTAEYIHQKEPAVDKGEQLARIIDKMADKLFFTVVSVGDELNAYRVFETLNARGVQLSSSDLIKNYLFVQAYESEKPEDLEMITECWSDILAKLPKAEQMPIFFRTFWNSKHEMVREKDIFKKVKEKIITGDSVFELIHEMNDEVAVYNALQDENHSLWQEPNYEYIKEQIRELRQYLQVRQPLSLLMAAYRKFEIGEFERLLRACVIISFRFNSICNFSPREQEHVYYSLAFEIATGKYKQFADTLPLLAKIYPNDQQFTASFIEYDNQKPAKYILLKIEKYINQLPIDPNSSDITIEHILPQKLTDPWNDSFTPEQHQEYHKRLGNLTLLQKNLNKALPNNTAFEEKKKQYANSKIMLTAKIGEYKDWNIDAITERQKWMADQAKTIWRIDEIDKLLR